MTRHYAHDYAPVRMMLDSNLVRRLDNASNELGIERGEFIRLAVKAALALHEAQPRSAVA